jgi:hypothetical protein
LYHLRNQNHLLKSTQFLILSPATPPAGYDEFINQTRLKMYQKDAIENEVSQDIAQKEEQMMQLYQSNPAAEEFYTTMQQRWMLLSRAAILRRQRALLLLEEC